ncbi:trichohyalin-like isoform X3 [Chelmon rostratus]|uniref:trichohyalin-like isoform X3 n=1 Tax=Chelmon rostratus TaxID=109905 RepID=UPI001BEC7375|nr:trichohyalin-like isoform X3 [Chelmon rostratus]
MLSVVQMTQECEGTVGVRRREVGCQSDSIQRRDAAVQVNLLTQQLSWRHCPGECGVPWQCVSVRAGEPGGGALLQHCSSQKTHTLDTEQPSPPLYLLCSPLRHTLIPTMPLFTPPAPPAPQQPESKEVQQNTWLRPPLPPGLIAPLSPRLAEEEEEEEGSSQCENNESLRSDRQSTVTAEKKKRRRRKSQRSEGGDQGGNMWGEKSRPVTLTNHIAGRVQPNEGTPSSTVHRDRKTNGDERCQPGCHQDAIQSEARSSIQSEARSSIQSQDRSSIQSEARSSILSEDRSSIQSEARSSIQSQDRSSIQSEARSSILSQDRSSIQSQDSSSTQIDRNETQGETWQCCRKRGIQTGRPAAQIQHTRAEGGENKTMVKEEEEELLVEEGGPKRRCTEEQRKDELMVKEEAEEEAGPRRKMLGSPIRYLVESEKWLRGLSAANHSTATEAKAKRKLGRLKREHQAEEEEGTGGVELTKRIDSSRKESSEDGVDGGWQLCQACGLTFACRSSLQLHLSGHRAGLRLSCHLCQEKFSCHCRHRGTRAAGDKQDAEVNGNNGRERKEREERSKEGEEETLLPASTKAPDWSRRRKRVCRNPQWWADYQTTMKKRLVTERWRRQQERDGWRGRRSKRCREEEEKMKPVCLKEHGGGEEKEEEKEVAEQPERPRRKMVGPPIRYLLESEGPSYGQLTANQDGVMGFKQGRKPQQKSKDGGGASDSTTMIDRSDAAEKQTGDMITERKTSQMITERQTGQKVAEREETLLPASTKAPDWSRRRKRVCRNPQWWADYQTTMKKRLVTERWRRQQERDGWRGRRSKRCREEEEKHTQGPVCLKEHGGGEEGERRRRDGGEEKEEEKEVAEQPERPRRKMVGPPIRYLLESEGPSYGQLTANQDGVMGFKQGRKPQQKSKDGGGASDSTTMIDRSDAAEKQTGDMITERKTSQMITERQTGQKVAEREETLLPASTKAPDWSRRRKRVCRNPQWWADYQTTMKKRLVTERWRRWQERDGWRGRRSKRCREEEEKMKPVCVKEHGGGEEKEEKKEVAEQPERPRRKMVGPPIRYLLESEEPLTANQDGAMGFKQGRKPQKKSKAGGGASDNATMIDRPEDTEQIDKHAGQTVTERKTCQSVSHRQTGHTVTDRQTGSYRWIYQVYKDLQSSQVTVISPCCVKLQRFL